MTNNLFLHAVHRISRGFPVTKWMRQDIAMTKRILVILTTRGNTFLKTIEECNPTTIENAICAGYFIVSRHSKGVSEEIVNRPYEDMENAEKAAASIGLLALSYQKIASLAKENI